MIKWNLQSIILKIFILFGYIIFTTCENEFQVYQNGYIVFCPCMGRFGNQIEQFLGVVSFAKDVERTLVLPHWVEYPEGVVGSVQIPFQKYFQVQPLQEYTNVILMDDFMKHIADKIWPKEKRTAFCYSFRSGTKSCQAKEGNPFGPYWDKFGIDFNLDESFGPLGYDLTFEAHKVGWKSKYPSSKFPVLAFTGAPGSFPVLEKDVHLQKYLKWSDPIEKKSNEIIKKFKQNEDDIFIAIHLRNGIDFKRACEHTKDMKKSNFFASAQCLGYNLENGILTQELCYPSEDTIMEQLEDAIKSKNAKYVYVASDQDHMISKFQNKFKKVKFLKSSSNNPQVDLCILGKANHAIVNCVSTFSSIVKRQRDSERKTTEFWAFKTTNLSHLNEDL